MMVSMVLTYGVTEGQLSERDKQILRTFAYKTRARVTHEAFEMLPFAFRDAPKESEATVDSHAAFLSGFDPVLYDCCPKSCCCYTGHLKELTACPKCGEPRFNAAGRARKKFTYIPLTPRLVGLYRNREMARKLRYRSEFIPSPVQHPVAGEKCAEIRRITSRGREGRCYCPSEVRDVFDGHLYRSLCDTPVTINGNPQSHHFFSDKRDIAVGISTDGFTPFKRRNQSCWPIIVYNYNLPPEERFHKDNILCVGVIPGPKKPHDSDSFLWPLVEELLQLAGGVSALDAAEEIPVLFALRVYSISTLR